jgi:hypothetical protein
MKNANMPAMPIANETTRAAFADGGHTMPNGLTKREYFAVMAMQGLLASESSASAANFAAAAVKAAEALLAELEATP